MSSVYKLEKRCGEWDTDTRLFAESASTHDQYRASTGKFIHKEAAFADDVDETIIESWNKSGVDNVLNYFIALEGGIIGTVADEDAYSVKISNCSYANADREVDDWNRS